MSLTGDLSPNRLISDRRSWFAMSAMGSKGLPGLLKGIGSRISQFCDSTLGWIPLVYCTKELKVVHKSFTLVFKRPGKYLFVSFWRACILYCKWNTTNKTCDRKWLEVRNKRFLGSCSRYLPFNRHFYYSLEILSQCQNHGVKLLIVLDEINWTPDIHLFTEVESRKSTSCP